MRAQFVSSLVELAKQDDRTVLLTGDLGFMVLEPFADAFPERFINVGVAEANMLGVAAGLAQQGFIPYCYSIATFASMRGYEELRDGAVTHGFCVRLVGVGGGFGYGSAGHSHWALEDMGLMRLQPGLAVVAPGSVEQVSAALPAVHSLHGPAYLRLAKEAVSIPELANRFAIGRPEVIRAGRDIVLITTGGMTHETLRSAAQLEARGLHPTVVQLPCLAPLPLATLSGIIASHSLALSVEDHHTCGGLGSLAAEAIAAVGAACRLVRVGVADPLDGRTGDEMWLRNRHGLSAESICAAVLDVARSRSAA